MNLEGKIKVIMQTNQVSDKFKKREFVVEYADNPEYPELIKFECIQDKCTLLDNYKEGDVVNVSYNLKGRKWENPAGGTQYFNTLQAWKIGYFTEEEKQAITEEAEDGSDDLPF